MGFQNWRMAPCPDLKPLPTAETCLDWAAAGFSMVSAGTLSGFMGFRLAPCLVLWDFKTDGWPPVPISNPSPQPKHPWIELLLRFRLAPCLVSWDFKTDGWPPVPISNPSPTAKTSLDWAAAGFSMVSAGTLPFFLGFRLAPCLVSKLTDGPLSRSQTLPRSRDLLGLSCGGL